MSSGETPLDLSEAEGLLISASTRAELDRAESLGVLRGQIWAEREVGAGVEPFAVGFWIDLHRVMFFDVWSWAGKQRHTEKSIGVEPYRIASELRRLADDLQFWYRKRTYRPIELLARLHHRLVWIHPFPNGNGRHARIVTDVIARHRFGIELDWGRSRGDSLATRDAYLVALRAADHGDFLPLVNFMTPLINRPLKAGSVLL